MRVKLYDAMGEFERHVDLPDELAKAECITYDGNPYLYVKPETYRCACGNFVLWPEPPPIQIAHVFKEQTSMQIHSTRWLTGTVAQARITSNVDVTVPFVDSAKLTVDDVRAIRLTGLWCPNVEKSHAEEARRAANAFCNTKQVGTRVFATVMALDVDGRLVVDMTKKCKSKVTSLRAHLLATNLFQSCEWNVASR